MKTKYFFLIGFLILVFPLHAQTNFMTKKGHLKIVTKIDNQNVSIETYELELFLNYTTKEMHGVLDMNKLISENPVLSRYVKNIDEPLLVHFSGIIPADDFMSVPHQLLSFNWPLKISIKNKKFEINLESTLEHAEGGYLTSCRLSTFGEFDASELGLTQLIPSMDDKIGIQIIQTILKNY